MARQPFLCRFVDNVQNIPAADPLGDLLARRSLNVKNTVTDKIVLILTSKNDPEADLIGIALRNRGIDYIRINGSDIPTHISIRYLVEKDSGLLNFQLIVKKHVLDVSKICLAWLRNFDLNQINFRGNKMVRTFSIQQWQDGFQILQNNLQCSWINSPHATIGANDHAKQLSVAKAIGFDVPATLITNDPAAAREFYYSYDGDILVKALHNHSVETQGKSYSMYSHKILEEDLSGLGDLVYAPCIIQERLTKKSELRVTVVGDQVFAAELDCKSAPAACHDIHRSAAIGFPIRVFNMDDEFSSHCVKLVKSFGLKYGAIDFILDKDDRRVFLEINPTGDWYWIERKLRLPITRAMLEMIVALSNFKLDESYLKGSYNRGQ